MSAVYILNESIHDYSKAAKYGRLVPVTHGRTPVFKTAVIMEVLEDALKNFQEDDHLLLSGPMLLNVMATAVIHPKVAVLKLVVFDAKRQEYTVRHIKGGKTNE